MYFDTLNSDYQEIILQFHVTLNQRVRKLQRAKIGLIESSQFDRANFFPFTFSMAPITA